MIFESYPWKQDLLRRKRMFIKYNTVEQLENRNAAAYTALEKAIFYSAFIIRKLIDCKSKLSDDADNYAIAVKKHKPLREINRNRNWPDIQNHDFEHSESETVKGRDICNWLIHSYVFFFGYNEEGTVEGFFVASDRERNNFLCYVEIKDWLAYIDFIANDSVVETCAVYSKEKKDYCYITKRRG